MTLFLHLLEILPGTCSGIAIFPSSGQCHLLINGTIFNTTGLIFSPAPRRFFCFSCSWKQHHWAFSKAYEPMQRADYKNMVCL